MAGEAVSTGSEIAGQPINLQIPIKLRISPDLKDEQQKFKELHVGSIGMKQ